MFVTIKTWISVWTSCIVALVCFTSVVANPQDYHASPDIRAGMNMPAKEISPGLYQHQFEHVADDGVKTSLSYLARKVKHLIELADTKVGFVALKCREGSIIEVTVTNSSAPPLWTAATADANATILVGNDSISCSDDDADDEERVSVLHRIVETPALVSEDRENGRFVYSILAEQTHFSHAFEHLSLQFYRGKRDIASVKEELKKATHPAIDDDDKQPDERDTGDSFTPRDSSDARLSTKVDSSASSVPNLKASSLDFLTLLHDGNRTAAMTAGGRHLLSSYSCDHEDDCASGTFNYDWDYESSPDTCCSGWGTCGWGSSTPYKPTCNECSSDKACATCSYCLLCSGYNSCDSCVYGSDRPHRVYKAAGYECEECRDSNDCEAGYVCKKAGSLGYGRWTCEEGEALACYSSMPDKSTRTASGTKHVVLLKSVTLTEHDSGEDAGTHEYYANTKISGEPSFGDKIMLPCLTHVDLGTQLTVDAEVAEVSCGDSFRFGIWDEDGLSDPLLFFDDAMGDRWFSTLDFLTSVTITYKSNSTKASFVLECKSCHDSCTEANSLLTTFTPSSDVSYAKSLSDVVPLEDHLPVGVWNYDSSTQKAIEVYDFTTAGMTVSCKNCHLTVSTADMYVEATLDAFAGFKDFAILADSAVTFHIEALLSGQPNSNQKWIKELFKQPFAIPGLSFGGKINFLLSKIEFTIGLKAKVDMITELSTAVDGSAEYKSDVVGTMKNGLVYDKDSGSKFLSSASISNENVGWENSINGQMSAKLSIRPCLQGGLWGGAGTFAAAHAYGEICADVFAKTTLNHDSQGYEVSPDTQSDISKALVKLDELLPTIFTSCEVSATSKHDTRLLVEAGVENVIIGADLYAAVNWGDTEDTQTGQDNEALRTNAYGPWPMKGLESSVPVASGCLCISACSLAGNSSSPSLPSTSDSSASDSPVLSPPPPAPTSTDVYMPTEGVFVEDSVALYGMQLYEWTTAAELAFRKTIADSAQVWVNHVRVDSVVELQIARRRLLQSSALDVAFAIYAESVEAAGAIADRVTEDIETGAFATAARMNGLSAVTSATATNGAAVTTSAAESTLHRSIFGLFSSLLVFVCLSP